MLARLPRLGAALLALTCAVLAAGGCSSPGPGPAPSGATASAAPSRPSPTPTTPTSPAPAPPAPAPAVRTVTVAVDGRTVTPRPADVEVRAGEPVRLVITSRSANQVHVHGPDLERDLPAGTAVALDLRFPDPGAYEVETHRPQLRLLRFVVR